MFLATFKNVTTSEIHFELKFKLLSKIEVSKVMLYKGKTKIDELSTFDDLSFKNLEENTKYKIKVIYLENEKEEELFLETITLAKEVTVSDFNFLKEEYYLKNNETEACVELDNESKLNIKTIYINNLETKIISKKNNSKYKLLINLKELAGVTDFKITKIVYESHKQLLSQKINDSIVVTKYILGELNVRSLIEENRSHYLLRSKDVKFLINLDNKSKYKVNTILLSINNQIHTFNEKDFNIIDEENIEITYAASNMWSSFITASIFEIHYDDFKGNIIEKKISFVYTSFYRVKSLEMKKVSTIGELQSMENGYIYSLTNDIDGINYNWKPYEFVGVISGNGFQIKNISINVTTDFEHSDIGLFTEFKGVIEKVAFKNFNITVDSNLNVFVGGIVGKSYRPLIIKNILINNFTIDIKNANDVTVGLVCGYQDKFGSLENIAIKDAKITVSNSNNIRFGSLIGFSDAYNILKEMYINKVITNLEAQSEVFMGTIIGYSYKNDIHRALITNSYFNSDTVTGVFTYNDIFVGSSHQTVLFNTFLSDDVTIRENKTIKEFSDETIVHYNELDNKQFYLEKLRFKTTDWQIDNLNYLKNNLPKLKAFLKKE